MESRDGCLADIASRQHGVFTADQAAGCGLTRRGMDQRVRSGLLVRLHPSVYGLAGAPETWHRDVVAAVLSLGDLAAASHRTAAELWSMTSRRGPRIEVVTSRWERVRRTPCTVHESNDLIVDDVAAVAGIPVTTPERTIVDLAANAPKWLVAACLDNGLRRQLLTIGGLDSFIARVARKGRRGVGVIRPLLEERAAWDGVTESELEDRLRQVVASAGLQMPVSQYVLTDLRGGFVCRADFAYPSRRVLIELDSEAFHMDRSTFRADRKKQNQALALGWRTLRFTWNELVERPKSVIALLADI